MCSSDLTALRERLRVLDEEIARLYDQATGRPHLSPAAEAAARETGTKIDALRKEANTLHERVRALEAQPTRTPAEEQAAMKLALDQILLQYRGKTALDIARLHKEIGTLKGTFKLAKDVTSATTWEKLVEGWRSGLLSGPEIGRAHV